MPLKKLLPVFTLALVTSLLSGVLGAFAFVKLYTPDSNELIRDFYLTENAVHVSPHSIRKSMDKGHQNFVLVDLRSQEEYEKEHIISAINIPAYKDKDNSDYGAVDRIVGAFSALRAENPGKEIVVYCYSMPCMTGRKVGAMLAEKDIFVKHLGIGWNEWRYFWTLWNHYHEWELTKVEDYIATGKEPGTAQLKDSLSPCSLDNQFGC